MVDIVGCASFIDQSGHDGGKIWHAEAVEHTRCHCFGDQHVAFMEDAREKRAGGGERPLVDVAPSTQYVEDAVEGGGHRTNFARQGFFDACDIATNPVGIVGVAHFLAKVRVVGDTVEICRRRGSARLTIAVLLKAVGCLSNVGRIPDGESFIEFHATEFGRRRIEIVEEHSAHTLAAVEQGDLQSPLTGRCRNHKESIIGPIDSATDDVSRRKFVPQLPVVSGTGRRVESVPCCGAVRPNITV